MTEEIPEIPEFTAFPIAPLWIWLVMLAATGVRLETIEPA